jgi:hypothetical protein
MPRVAVLALQTDPNSSVQGRGIEVSVADLDYLLASQEPKRPLPPKGRRCGRTPTHDHHEFYAEVVRIVLAAGRLPPKEGLNRRMIAWCAETWEQPPDESTVRGWNADLYTRLGLE